MVALSVVIFGVIAFQRLPRNLMPDISYPSVTVRTEYTGAAPLDVEQRVSRRLEEVLSQVRNLRRVSSVSRAEVSDVTLEFAWDTDMSLATTEVREKVSQAMLPDEAEKPTFLRYDPTLDPILQLGLHGALEGSSAEPVRGLEDEAALIALRTFAEEELEQVLESIPGVAGVRVRGGLEREVRVDVDEARLRAHDIPIDLVARRIEQENLNRASGILYEGDQARAVRTVNEFRDLEEIRDLILRRDDTVPVRLRDVAEVSFGYADPEVITRVDGRPCVKIDIFKEADANVVEVAARVREGVFGTAAERRRLAEIRRRERRARSGGEAAGGADAPEGAAGDQEDEAGEAGSGEAAPPPPGPGPSRPDFLASRLPDGMRLDVLSDQSVFIRDALDDVRRTVLTGGVLAVLVLLAFLRSGWFTLAVGLSIPLSVMAAFIAMHLAGVSLNMMSLGGLALGVGMLVDNSVVVLESIFRCRESGDAPRTAAVRGTGAVASAVTASTLTTVAVFFPIVFVEGIAGQVFRDQALTVVISLIASLAAALWFIPSVVCRRLGASGAVLAEGALSRGGERPPVERWLRGPGRPHPLRELRGRLAAVPRRGVRGWILVLPAVLVVLPVGLLDVVLGMLSWAAIVLFARIARLVRAVARASGPLRRAVGAGVVRSLDGILGAIHGAYLALLGRALEHRGGVVLVAASAGVAVFLLLGNLSTELIPQVHQGEFTVEVHLPRSTRIEETDRVIRPWERRLLEDSAFEDVASVTTTIGVERDEMAEADEGEHTAKLLVRVARPGAGDGPAGETAFASARRSRDRPGAPGDMSRAVPEDAGTGAGDLREREERVKRRIREVLRDATFESVEIAHPVLFSFKTPIEVEVAGHDLGELSRITREVERRLDGLPELEDVRSTLARGNPEVQLFLDRELLSRFDLGVAEVGQVVRSKVQGEVASHFAIGDRKVAIRVRLAEADRDSLENLRDIVVHSGDGVDLRLGDLLREGRSRSAGGSPEEGDSLVIGEGPAEIRRIDHQRAAVVSANLSGMSLGAATESIQEALEGVEHPAAFSVGFGGQKEEMDRAVSSLWRALLLAVFLVYVVMAIQFESLVQPFVIILSIPLALVGVVPVLWVLDMPLSIVVFIGMIVLAGIVVNNAIVLVDTANRLSSEGMPFRDALLRAGALRLRPILMTTTTTVLGLLPLTGFFSGIEGLEQFLGSGQGEEIRAPLAVTVVAGLVTSTLLTLVVIPVIASLVHTGAAALRGPVAGGTAPRDGGEAGRAT